MDPITPASLEAIAPPYPIRELTFREGGQTLVKSQVLDIMHIAFSVIDVFPIASALMSALLKIMIETIMMDSFQVISARRYAFLFCYRTL